MYESALWRENSFLTTPTASQFCKGKPVAGRTELQGKLIYRENGDGLRDWEYIFGTSRSIDIISSYHPTQYTLYLSQLFIPTHSCRVFIDPCNLCSSSWPGYHILSPSSYTPPARIALSYEFPLHAVRGAAEC
jgi:hypothetical protein